MDETRFDLVESELLLNGYDGLRNANAVEVQNAGQPAQPRGNDEPRPRRRGVRFFGFL